MLDKLLAKGLFAVITVVLTVFGIAVWADLVNILAGPFDEMLYAALVGFMSWCMVRLKRLGSSGKL